MPTNNERVGKALELLNGGLRPFVEREMRAVYADRWAQEAAASLREGRALARDGGDPHLDSQALLAVVWEQWNPVFRNVLGHAERSLVSELRETRNRWAHQELFKTDDAYRALDSVHRLLTAVAAPEAVEAERQKQELLRVRFEEQARYETRKAATTPIESKLPAGLRPWREVATPHPDVASGRYQQAEFAADLGQVHRGEGSGEYRDPREFFERTFMTEGLRHLLVDAVRRLSGSGGNPVVELQTNFGGGKTHSMLALYHLCAGLPAGQLPGVDAVLREAGASRPPKAQRAVLVGTAVSPSDPRTKPDGTVVRTLWGELAWQLAGAEGYAVVAEADRRGVSPGSDALRAVFERAAPCLILIDEWVAFARMLYGVDGLAAGSFDANMTFAQALTEAARQAPRTLVVASIPASDIEVGGEAGKLALERIRNTFGRLEASWRPASAEEGFEIVRRRLFQPLTTQQQFRARDAVAKAFSELYRSDSGEFPSACREGDYERRIRDAYPIHPELFDRLYNDWSTLDRFQRTRGVLRLMAAVIHTLWERQDGSLLIMPATVPIDDPSVQFELTQYLEDPWVPILERDVDGPNSLPLAIDRATPALGRYSACRRVARTLYLGSAPTLHTSRRGLDARSIALGCAQPGETVATFGDALRRLGDQATHLYVDNTRYWFSTQPSVNRLTQDRAEQVREESVEEEIVRRLRAAQGNRGDFARVHTAPASSGDVPDEPEARLVILGPRHPHAAKGDDSPARREAAALLEARGAGPRRYRNALVFLAPDRARLQELASAARQYIAWQSIHDERDALNLDSFQRGQAESKRKTADDTVRKRIPEAYTWLLYPTQPVPQGDLEWEEQRLQPDEALARNASRKLADVDGLTMRLAATELRRDLDRVPLWRGDHVGVRQLRDDYAQYPYLYRLKDAGVLLQAIVDGVRSLAWEQETFAYADRWDESRGEYAGLKAGEGASVILNDQSVVVKPEAARHQLDRQRAAESSPTADSASKGPTAVAVHAIRLQSEATQPPTAVGWHGPDTAVSEDHAGILGPDRSRSVPAIRPQSEAAMQSEAVRFHASIRLDPARVSRDADEIAREVIANLASALHAEVEVTLEIQARFPDGVPEHVRRTVLENCRTLKITGADFGPE